MLPDKFIPSRSQLKSNELDSDCYILDGQFVWSVSSLKPTSKNTFGNPILFFFFVLLHRKTVLLKDKKQITAKGIQNFFIKNYERFGITAKNLPVIVKTRDLKKHVIFRESIVSFGLENLHWQTS